MATPRYDKLFADWLKRNPTVAGEVRELSVLHDDWCRMLHSRGKKDCNCNPEFSLQKVPWKPGDFGEVAIVPAPPAESN